MLTASIRKRVIIAGAVFVCGVQSPASAQGLAESLDGKNCRGSTLYKMQFDGRANYAFSRTDNGLMVHVTSVRGKIADHQGTVPVNVAGTKITVTTKSGTKTELTFNPKTKSLNGTNTLPMQIWTLCN